MFIVWIGAFHVVDGFDGNGCRQKLLQHVKRNIQIMIMHHDDGVALAAARPALASARGPG